jgi:NAD(P)-dependent dehydrogenase (short-subunit alcohol dehydrogenase family)
LNNSEVPADIKPLQEADKIENALSRYGIPQEVAEALVWLTSHRSSYIAAAVLAVNGGKAGV